MLEYATQVTYFYVLASGTTVVELSLVHSEHYSFYIRY